MPHGRGDEFHHGSGGWTFAIDQGRRACAIYIFRTSYRHTQAETSQFSMKPLSPRFLSLPVEISAQLYIGDYYADTLQLSARNMRRSARCFSMCGSKGRSGGGASHSRRACRTETGAASASLFCHFMRLPSQIFAMEESDLRP